MATVAELLTKFTANTTGLKKGLAEAKAGTNAFGKGVVGANSKVLKFNTGLAGTTKGLLQSAKGMVGMAVAIGVAIRVLKQAITIFAEYEQSMANVRSVTKATHEEFAVLEQAAKNAGETTRFTANQAADALYYLASAGLTATESTEALEGVLLLAGATGSDLAFTAQTMTAVISQYSLKTEESTRVSNTFAAAIANSQATMSKLSNAFLQVGPVAAGLGISLEETTGTLEVLFNAGFQGQKAGRALKSALADLSNESSVANKKLSALGISFEEIDPAIVGMSGAIQVLHEKGIGVSSALDIFGKVAGPQMAVLIKQGGDAIDEYTEAVTNTNEAAEQYAIQNDTLAGDMDILKSVTQSVAIEFGEGFEPALRALIESATNLGIFLKPLIGSLSDLGGVGLWLTLGPMKLLSEVFGFVGNQITKVMNRIDIWNAKMMDLAENNAFFAKALNIATLGMLNHQKALEDEIESYKLVDVWQSHILGLEEARAEALEVLNQRKLEAEKLERSLAEIEAQRIQDLVDTRVKAEERVANARRIADIQLREGFINQQEYNEKMISANENLINSLAEVGYDGLGDYVGDGVIRQAIEEINLLTEANKALNETEESQRKILSDLKQEHADSIAREQEKRAARKANLKEELQDQADAQAELLQGEIDNQNAITESIEAAQIARGEAALAAALKEKQGLEDAKQAAEELHQTYVDMAMQIPGQIAQIFSALRSLSDSRRDYEVQVLDAEAAARIEAGEDAVAVAEDIEKRKAVIEYKYALSSWKLQLASSIASGAQMILNGFNTEPFIPVGLIAGALATTLAAIQIGAVSKAKPQKNFAIGTSGFQIPEGFPNDTFQAGFSSGEILNVQTPSQQGSSLDGLTQTIIVQLADGPIIKTVNRGLADRKIKVPA